MRSWYYAKVELFQISPFLGGVCGGAYLMKERYQVFAPKYWMGYKSHKEFPKGSYTDKFKFIGVFVLSYKEASK
ncbi:hypothetical protein ES708_09752 [subsurface metagenome]